MVEVTKHINFSDSSELILFDSDSLYPSQKLKTEFIPKIGNNFILFQLINSYLFQSFTLKEFLNLYNEKFIYKYGQKISEDINLLISKLENNICINFNNCIKINQKHTKQLIKLSKIIQLSYLSIKRHKLMN